MTGKIALAGLVLAGGHSRRFGSEKAVADFAGQSLLRRAIDTLKPFTPRIAVSAAVASAAEHAARAMGFPIVHDRADLEAGPLLGVLSGLQWARSVGATALITLPCDVVCIPHDALEALARAGAAYIATTRGAESLCAIWPAAGLPSLEATLKRGHPAVLEALHSLNAAEILVAGDDVFLNVNTPEDLARAEAIISRK